MNINLRINIYLIALFLNFTINRLFNSFFSVFNALYIVLMLQFIALEASTILLYSPNTVESKLYNIIEFDLFVIFNIACSEFVRFNVLSLVSAFCLIFSMVSWDRFLPLFKLPIFNRLFKL
uniref:Uncharacterized protein n=1 Tax=Porodaedalea pini TaxID=108901 RepID=A0A5B9R942_9AGAM|nr:hypothetical protein PPIT_000102 [Porodaedalea pini]QEG56991.1 hypothetical protein PPIT_000102 [Porodaedalea pini]